MKEYAVTIPDRGVVKVIATTPLEAVTEVLDALGLRYIDTKFRVSELVPLASYTINPQPLA